MSSMPVPIATLPIETFEQITCRDCHYVVIPHLYNPALVQRHPGLIFWASHYNQLRAAKRLIAAGADVDNPILLEADGYTQLNKSPYQVYQDVYRRARHPDDSQPVGYPDRCYLHPAVMNGHLDMVKLLVDAGASITAPSRRLCLCEEHPLHGDPKPSKRGSFYPPLHSAICFGQDHIAKWLLQQGAPTTWSAEFLPITTALHCAASLGRVEMISFIIQEGYQTDIHELDSMTFSPIWRAYQHDQWIAFDLLLAMGADIDDDIGYGYTMLVDACLFNAFTRAFHLAENGANVNVQCLALPDGLSVDSLYSVLDLIRKGRGDICFRPIDICCWRSTDRVDGKPLSPGLSCTKYEPLRMEKKTRAELVSALLASGATIDAGSTSLNQIPPLVAAASHHMPDVVKVLIEGGALVDLPDWNGVTPLAAALVYPETSCPHHSHDRDFADKHISRWFASRNHYVGWVNYDNRQSAWLERLPENSHLSNRSATIGHSQHFMPVSSAYAPPRPPSCFFLRHCVKLLVEHGADLNRADKAGHTPLARLVVPPPARRFLKPAADERMINRPIHPEDQRQLLSLFIEYGIDTKVKFPRPAALNGYKAAGSTQDPSSNMVMTWPDTAMKHAFSDGDIELCHLLAAGEVNRDDVWSMLEHLWLEAGQLKGVDFELFGRAYAFLKSLSLGNSVPNTAGCLAVALRTGRLDDARSIMEADELSLEELQMKVTWESSLMKDTAESIEIGILCLHQAATMPFSGPIKFSITQWLLELGIKPTCQTLLRAVSLRDLETIALLIKHGAVFNVADDETGMAVDKDFGERDVSRGCRNPLRLAIELGNIDIVKAILSNSNYIDPHYRTYYLREACCRLRPRVVACLLDHPIMHIQEADLSQALADPDHPESTLPFIHLTQRAEFLCGTGYRSGLTFQVNPHSRLSFVDSWIGCVSAMAQAGVDPALKDWKTGKSGLDYLGSHLVYMGNS
ncbi:ankyrin repeat-containing domain protein [Podospora fimiseda]|uniref:Ankyrin repeat-containing domain protein n=1 Tax=Podospora fimiseda TaxID=252190 RepID=A0AAN7H3G9_9PEZI|nr:ankyrin repeat-containing domain protein [Podospora fimiseda]